jgi:transposase
MARTSRLANVEFAKQVADAYMAGMNRQEMADEFGAHVDTISDWIRDPRVQAHARITASERIARITRKLDREMERRLDEVEDMDPELLLKIRKEYMDRPVKIDMNTSGQVDSPENIGEIVGALEDNPELAEVLKRLTKG